MVLIRGGVGHSICDDPKTTPAPHEEVLKAMPRRLASLPKARAHETTLVFCAKYLFQATGAHPLTSLLPPLIHLPAREAERHAQLQLLLQLLRQEAAEAETGTELVIPRLVDSLLVYVVRAWLEDQPVGAGGWFGALRDPAIARALSLIHEQPQKAWPVASLARQVAQSRPTFARRFAELVGETPVAYLTRWRMCLATKLLAETELSLAEVAARIGYETAAAFSKAFRRSHGDAPGGDRTGALWRVFELTAGHLLESENCRTSRRIHVGRVPRPVNRQCSTVLSDLWKDARAEGELMAERLKRGDACVPTPRSPRWRCPATRQCLRKMAPTCRERLDS